MEITKDNIKFIIFKKKHTATIIEIPKDKHTLLIPRFVEYKQEQFKIISISYTAYTSSGKLENIIFPEDSEVESFENGSFHYMSNLKKLQIPKSLKFIGDYWISSSSNLSEIEISPNNKHFSYVENKFLVGKSSEDSETFDTLHLIKSGIDEVVIPPYIKFITKSSFLNRHKSIIFPPDSKLKEIKKDTEVPYGVERLVLSGSVENIHLSFLRSLRYIKEISITGENKNCTIIDDKFIVKKKTNTSLNFDELVYLLKIDCEEVIIPPEIKYVNEYSLYDAYNLKSVIFPSNSQLKIIENYSINPYCLERLIIPGCVENIFGNKFTLLNKLTELQINGECKNYYLFDNKILLKKNDEFDEIIFAVKNIESVIIPSSVKTISSYAFYNCKQLTEITFSSNSSLEKICKYGIYICPIEKFVFPETVQYVEENALANNVNLISVQFNSKNIKIRMNCFLNCLNLEVISFPYATNINFDFYDCKLPDEAEIHVRRDVKLFGGLSKYKEYIKYVFGPEEAEIVKYDEPKIKTVIPIEHKIETKLPPIKKYIPKSDIDETIEQQKEQNHQQSKRLEIYLKHIRFLEQRLSKYERVIPFDPSTNNQNEETDYESEEKQVNTNQNINFFMDDSDEEGHEIVSKIGEGNSSIAYKVIDHQHKRVLCKKVLKEKEYETVFPEFQKKMKEIEVLNQDRHPSICEVIGVKIEGRHENEREEENEKEKERGSFEEEDNDDDNTKEGKEHKTASFYFEYLPYNVSKCLSENILNNTMKTKIAIEVAFGMSFIHSKKQIHRNLNISNIRLNNVYESKIINFSQVRVSSFGISNRTLTKSIGEIAYMSPEMAREEDYNEKTDVYSYGVILHVLFSGKPPKQSMNEKLSKKEAILAEPSKWISSKCINLIKKCISNEIQQRPSFDEIINEIYSNNFELASEIDISSVLRRFLSLNRFRSQHQNKS